MKNIVRVLCGFFVLVSLQAQAETPAQADNHKALTFLVGLGLTAGGDDLVEFNYTDGSSEELKAGGFYDFKAGALYKAKGSTFSLQTTIGYHGDSLDAENGDASFNRFPLDVLGFYNHQNHRIGFGGTYHLSPEFEIDILGIDDTVEFDDSVGAVIEYGYTYDKSVIFGLRYVDIDYSVDGVSEKIDGSHFGVYIYGGF